MSERKQGFQNLIVWQKSMDLVEDVYRLTKSFPKYEIYGLRSQMRAAAISIPSNIAEGYGRQSAKTFSHFLSIAFGSLCELETQITIAKRLGYLENSKSDLDLMKEVAKMLYSMRNRKS